MHLVIGFHLSLKTGKLPAVSVFLQFMYLRVVIIHIIMGFIMGLYSNCLFIHKSGE